MDATSGSVRSKETNAGNFVCDIVRDVTRADCVIINGGTLRSDSVCGCVWLCPTVHGKGAMPDDTAVCGMVAWLGPRPWRVEDQGPAEPSSLHDRPCGAACFRRTVAGDFERGSERLASAGRKVPAGVGSTVCVQSTNH